MRYLIQYKKEFIVTIALFVAILLVAFNDVWAIIHGSFSLENLLESLGSIIAIMGWWTNTPTSEANAKATALMRYEKAELKYGEMEGAWTGEEDDEEDEFYDEDEEEAGDGETESE